jgi:hypothetical protein
MVMEYRYTLYYIKVMLGPEVLLEDYVFVSPRYPHNKIEFEFEQAKQHGSILANAQIFITDEISGERLRIKPQAFHGFKITWGKCTDHEQEGGNYCGRCRKRLFKLVVANSLS